jgi:hypothetical protein
MRREGAALIHKQPLLAHGCHMLNDLVGTQVITPGLNAFRGRFLGVETTADWTAPEPNPQVGSLARGRVLPPPNLPPLGGGAKLPPQRGGEVRQSQETYP